MQYDFRLTITLLKACMFENLLCVHLGFRHPMNGTFKPEEDVDYFDKYISLSTQCSVFDIYSML